jgi:glycosyltransferase involved in cell wall biosynthesis
VNEPELVLDIFPGLFPAGGIGRYVRDLCAALRTLPGAPKYQFAYPFNLREAARARYRENELLEIPFGWRRMRVACMLSARMGIPFDALYEKPLLFHSPLGYGPILNGSRTIANVHDLTFIEHPEWHPFRTTFFLQNTAPIVAKQAARVLCHSEWVRREVQRTFSIPAERFVVIPPPVGHDFHPVPRPEAQEHVRKRFGLGGEFVLHVGTIEPRKNHVRLIEAFENMRKAGFPGPLVLVGKDGWRIGPILERLAASPERANIMRISDATEEDLVALYAACTVVAFPSLEEGFGMPILESMACAAPCVTGDRTAMVEVGEGYATLVPPEDVNALTDALLATWRDPSHREKAAALGPARAAEYSHEKWAAKTFALYRSELALARASSARA